MAHIVPHSTHSSPSVRSTTTVPSTCFLNIDGPTFVSTVSAPEGVVIDKEGDTVFDQEASKKHSPQLLSVPILPPPPIMTSHRRSSVGIEGVKSRSKREKEMQLGQGSDTKEQAKNEQGIQRKEETYQLHATMGTTVQGCTGEPALYIKDNQIPRDDRHSGMNRAPLSENPAKRRISLSAGRMNYLYLVDTKVTALLDKLTPKTFDTISDKVIAWVNRSKNERDSRTLILVIRIVYEQVAYEPVCTELYARLCRKMMEQISPEIQDNDMRDAKGKPITGGQLFRKYLLNRCQADFECGWVAKEATATAKASDDEAIETADERKGDESELNSEEYHAAQRAKCQGLGLIKFIGELFKLQMLTERIMHECIKKLLGNVEYPEEVAIERLCQLLKIVGQQLDVPKARAHMDVYLTRMKEVCESLSPHIQIMLQDVIELRDRKWETRDTAVVPTILSAVHEAAAKEKANAEAQSCQRQLNMSRGGSRCGGEQNMESGLNGWHTAGGSVPRPPPKAGDLSQFGKISKDVGAPVVMGPSNVFTKKDANAKRDSLSRTSSSSNMFSVLSQNPSSLVVDTTAKSSRLPSRKPSMDFGRGGVPEPIQRRKLQLLPRSRLTAAEEASTAASENETETPIQMSEANAKKKIGEDVKEFFAVRNMEGADVYFSNLPEEHHFRLVDKLVGSALESKEVDAALVLGFFAQASFKGQCSLNVFEAGFMPMAAFLDDIVIDAPNAFKFMTIMLKGASFDKDKERPTWIVGKSMNGDKLLHSVSP